MPVMISACVYCLLQVDYLPSGEGVQGSPKASRSGRCNAARAVSQQRSVGHEYVSSLAQLPCDLSEGNHIFCVREPCQSDKPNHRSAVIRIVFCMYSC